MCIIIYSVNSNIYLGNRGRTKRRRRKRKTEGIGNGSVAEHRTPDRKVAGSITGRSKPSEPLLCFIILIQTHEKFKRTFIY